MTNFRKARTNIDFSKHELIIKKTEYFKEYWLKIPNKCQNNIKYINIGGIMAVTGDYGNWIFCREFYPSANGYCSDTYWAEKLRISSTQDPYEFNYDMAIKEAKELKEEYPKFSKSIDEFILSFEDEYDFVEACRDLHQKTDLDYECLPTGKIYKFWFMAILDGFEEICIRIGIQQTLDKKKI
jgi:hypothetical protein